MVVAAFVLGMVLSVVMGLVVIGRERQRFSQDRPPVLFDEAVAYIWVIQTVDERAAATLTEDDAQFLVNAIGAALSDPNRYAENVQAIEVESPQNPVGPTSDAPSGDAAGSSKAERAARPASEPASGSDSFLSDFGLVDYLVTLDGPRGEPYSEFEAFSVVEAVERYLAAIGATGLVETGSIEE